MKILIIGFEPATKISYPHTKALLTFFGNDLLDYFYFRERGYFLSDPKNFVSSIRFIYTLFNVVVYTLRLFIKLRFGGYTRIVAIDNLAYVVASYLFSDAVLWSHDFVTDDQEHSTSLIQKFIASRVKSRLQRNGKLIIQDEVRKTLFLKSVGIDDAKSINCFFLPVSLPPCPVEIHDVSEKPIVLQIGGINAYRSGSDKILNHYQSFSDTYDLAFHGYLDPKLIPNLELARRRPWVSTFLTEPSDLYKIVEKCDIGFLFYFSSNQNFYNISKASGQFVEFIRCGKPVVICGESSLSTFVIEKRVGVAIDDISGLVGAINHIKSNYTQYSQNALDLYEAEYNIHPYLNKLSNWIGLN